MEDRPDPSLYSYGCPSEYVTSVGILRSDLRGGLRGSSLVPPEYVVIGPSPPLYASRVCSYPAESSSILAYLFGPRGKN